MSSFAREYTASYSFDNLHIIMINFTENKIYICGREIL